MFAVMDTHEVLNTRYADLDGSPLSGLGFPDAAAWSSRPTTYSELAARWLTCNAADLGGAEHLLDIVDG